MRNESVSPRVAFLGALAFGASLLAQPVINDVVNAANRIPSGFPSYGIAQGALFAITGTGLGPDTLQQAGFPLPTGDGLAGVTVRIDVGGSSANAILAYVSANEIGAILPSGTPLGTGTVTVNNNGATVTYPITVVAAAFGAFSLDYYSGLQNAAAFNVNGDGSTVWNYSGAPGQTAMTGQTVLLQGTGLGAVTVDETQSDSSGTPDTSSLKVFVGVKQATVVSAARGVFPGLPDGFPVFPVPTGIAAWDVVAFVVPDGVTGCHVPVTVQIGNFVSNSVWIAASADGSPCVDRNTADFGDSILLSGTARVGTINMLRTTIRSSTNGLITEIGSEIGTANFFQFDVPNPVNVLFSNYAAPTLAFNINPGTCLVQMSRIVTPVNTGGGTSGGSSNPLKVLDAGAVINLKNSSNVTYKLNQSKAGGYGGGLGSSFIIPPLPPDTSKLFMIPGTITADNGAGGSDIPAFNVSVTLPKPALTFDNIDAISNAISRTDGVTLKWSGGDPNSYVNIVGVSINQTGNVTLTGSFTCTERVSAGTFVVPSWVTMTLPVTVSKAGPPIGSLGIWNYALSRVSIPTLDIATFAAVMETQKAVQFQ